jgi:hypothetical protein
VTEADETYASSASFYGTNGPWFPLPDPPWPSVRGAPGVTAHKLSANRGHARPGSDRPVVLSAAPEPYAAEHGTHVEEVPVC